MHCRRVNKMLGFTTELSYRVIVTVLLLGVLGNCTDPTMITSEGEGAENNRSDQQPQNSSSTSLESYESVNGKDNGDRDESSALSRSIPFYSRGGSSHNNRDYHRDYTNNYRDTHQPSYYYSSDRTRDRDAASSMSSESVPSSIISSTSYSIKSGSSSGSSGTNVYMNTKPLPFIITAERAPAAGAPDRSEYFNRNNKKGSSPTSYYDDYPRRDSSSHYSSNTRNQDPCYNQRNCNPNKSDDENKSYYAVLNGNIRYPERQWESSTRLQQQKYGGNRRNDDIEDRDHHRRPAIYERLPSVPFRVSGLGLEKDRIYYQPELDGGDEEDTKRRVTRTSTSSPSGWIKLQPSMSHKTYDPFLPKNKEQQQQSLGQTSAKKDDDNKENNSENNNPSEFANRIGVEISPESFAARWGWGSEGGPKGTRLPAWLEELNNKYQGSDVRRPHGPTRDEDTKNWVKLDPIPVAGVSISKWVPKGTSPEELPSTGNLIRDRPQAWWDRPEPPIPVIKNPAKYGWTASSSTRLPTFTSQKRPSDLDGWKDVIYPDTPTSATASWVESSTSLKGLAPYPSSFTQTSSSGSGWKSDHRDHIRRPLVASWSAPGSSSSSGSHHRFNVRRPTGGSGGSNYPDPHAGDDDPRWVLVSNSRRGTTPSHNPNNRYSERHRYRPPVDRWRDDLDLPDRDQELDPDRDYYYTSRRVAKHVKLDVQPAFVQQPDEEDDEAFRRVNATLQTLEPVLNHKGDKPRVFSSSTTPNPKKPQQQAQATAVVKKHVRPTPAPSRYASFLSSLIGDGRKLTGTETSTAAASSSSTVKSPTNATSVVITRRPPSFKPILAAVGAGMIPATMAAVLPMVMGRRRKRAASLSPDLIQDQPPFFQPLILRNNLVYVPAESLPRQTRSMKNGRRTYLQSNINSIAR